MTALVERYTNSDAALAALEDHQEERTNAAIGKAEAMATKRRLEANREADRENEIVMVPIGGETVPMYPIEPGKVLEVSRAVIEGHQTGDDLMLIEAADEKRQLFAEKNYHPDVFDREFFNGFDRDEMDDAWNEWSNRSQNVKDPLGNR